jgi:hypothetical protein
LSKRGYFRAGVTIIEPGEVEEVKRDALGSDLALYVLRTEEGYGRDGFFDAVRSSLPLDPPLDGPNNKWDALSDSIWWGVFELDTPGAVILWPDAGAMKAFSPNNFEIAMYIFGCVEIFGRPQGH